MPLLLSTSRLYSILTIEDNGIGFDPSVAASGISLRNIKNRASYYNGTVNVISAPNKGCRLEIMIPLNPTIYVKTGGAVKEASS